MPVGSHSLLWLVTRKLLLELPHQGGRLLLLLGLLQTLPGKQRLLGLHRLETEGLTLGLRGLLGLGGLLHLEEPLLLSHLWLSGSHWVLRKGPRGKVWVCRRQHGIDSSAHQRALLEGLMVESLRARQRLQVRRCLLLHVTTRLLLYLSEPFHQCWVGMRSWVGSGVIAGRQNHTADLLLWGLLQRHLCSIHRVALGHGLCLLQPWILGELRGGPCLCSKESSLVPRLTLENKAKDNSRS